jgi:hypothetical protein
VSVAKAGEVYENSVTGDRVGTEIRLTNTPRGYIVLQIKLDRT